MCQVRKGIDRACWLNMYISSFYLQYPGLAGSDNETCTDTLYLQFPAASFDTNCRWHLVIEYKYLDRTLIPIMNNGNVGLKQIPLHFISWFFFNSIH